MPGTNKTSLNLAVELFSSLIVTVPLPVIIGNSPTLSRVLITGVKEVKINQSPVQWDVAPESINHPSLGLFSFAIIAVSTASSSSSIANAADLLLSLSLSRSISWAVLTCCCCQVALFFLDFLSSETSFSSFSSFLFFLFFLTQFFLDVLQNLVICPILSHLWHFADFIHSALALFACSSALDLIRDSVSVSLKIISSMVIS